MRLRRYIVQRLLLALPVMLGVLVLVFIVGRVLPGDPIHLLAGGQDVDEVLIKKIRHDLHLDVPLYQQFVYYIQDIARGDLGTSWSTGNPVIRDMAQRFPATLELTLLSLTLCLSVAIPLGVLAAVRRDTVFDHLARVVSLIGVAMPAFWLGIVLALLFYFALGWLPAPMGRLESHVLELKRITGLYLVDSLLQGDFRAFVSAARCLVLPVVALAMRDMAQLTRLTRSTMIEVLSSDYIQAARAQGLPNRLIHYRLALKNALLVPITQVGLIFGHLIGGSVLIETVFAWPGLGIWAVNGALARDFNPVQGFAVFAALMQVLIYLTVDLVYFAVDPRIKA
jgi:peptide/nickel transport system permease protein